MSEFEIVFCHYTTLIISNISIKGINSKSSMLAHYSGFSFPKERFFSRKAFVFGSIFLSLVTSS